MPPRLMHVDLDAFFVEVCRQRMPELRGVDHIIVGGRPDGRGVVTSASYGARKFGVKSGMPTGRALRLCPDATVVSGDFDWYREASHTVRAVLERHAPRVVMAGMDEAYLDFTGTEQLWPVSLLPMAEAIRKDVKQETGLDVSIGIGPNRAVAKMGSDFAKPRGIVEVRAGWEAGFVAGLPLRAFPGVGPKTAARLAEKGLTEAWEVQQMPLARLRSLIGEEAAALKLRFEGRGGTTLTRREAAKSISRETTLATDEIDLSRLEARLARLTAHVASQLREEGLQARTVVLKLRHGDFHTVTRRTTLVEATALDAELLSAATKLLAPAFREARLRRQGIRLIGIGTTNLVPAAPPDLFEDPTRHRQRTLTEAVDRVRDKFGFESLTPGRLMPTRRRRPRDGE
ncbi:MAG: DNA polymerase IV [Gemmatimonadales bacterium]